MNAGRQQKIDIVAPARVDAGPSAIFGTGEMADLTRAYDWSHTPVGPVEQWPETLLTTVNTLLSSRHPMFLWWGDELVQFYNDAYRPSIREDKHPSALGQRGRECWPEIWSIIGPQIDAVMTRGEASWHENQLVPIYRNGKLEDVYWTYGYSPVRSSTGEIHGTLVVCTETTEIVLARHQLQRERERLADLFQQAPAFFAVLRGPEHVFEMINPPYQELIGQRDVLGKAVREAVPEAEGQGFIALLDEVYRTGKPFIGRGTPIELARSTPQLLEVRYLDFVYQPRRDTDGRVSGIIVLGVDVTESKRAEQVLLQSEKLNAVGRLASSIAHEINNPLEAVTNLLYLAQQAAVNPQAMRYLTTAEAELKRVSAIASQTLRFYRQSTNPKPVTSEELIDATLPLYQSRIVNSHVKIERRHRTRRAVVCFEGEIRQVLSNLIGNAIDAMKVTGGRLLIRSREGTDWTTGRGGIILTVADSGSGMPRHTLSRIFEPFFTTKGEKGTGLGLWISREIVDRHRGVLKVRSRQSTPGSGTVFSLFLPYDDEVGVSA
ncbi:MAG TPA: ATP-binding protein [Silvibacterium sp.]|nr:ATP-binding protein [Silvibacterium sp.]